MIEKCVQKKFLYCVQANYGGIRGKMPDDENEDENSDTDGEEMGNEGKRGEVRDDINHKPTCSQIFVLFLTN